MHLQEQVESIVLGLEPNARFSPLYPNHVVGGWLMKAFIPKKYKHETLVPIAEAIDRWMSQHRNLSVWILFDK